MTVGDDLTCRDIFSLTVFDDVLARLLVEDFKVDRFSAIGLTGRLPAWREFFEQLAEVLAGDAGEGRMRQGHAE